MYKNARKRVKSANSPAERNIPFDIPDVFKKRAPNDPVGREVPTNPWDIDRRLNWGPR